MEEIKPPTQEELLEEEGLEFKKNEVCDTWRWGNVICEIFYRESDKTYWEVIYKTGGDGDTHGLRDNDYSIQEVVPQTVEIINYIPKNK